MDIFQVIKRPLRTEKTTLLKEKFNQVVFAVDIRANKREIKQALENLFHTRVARVNTIRMSGKKKRLGVHEGRRPHWKKAIVTLEPGEKIELFEA